MRILVDYRPALRQRTGVGEYIHELVRAVARRGTDDVAIFTSSWRDRPAPDLAATLGVEVVDRRIPVRLLNALWHRAGWPPVERLGIHADVVHAAHPLLIPSVEAAQVVTIHDLFFLTEPTSVRAEIRRDYPQRAGPHARRADAVITSSEYGKRQVVDLLSVDPAKVHVIPPGAPSWRQLGNAPNMPSAGYVFFMGTLEPRKNVRGLLDAWARVITALPGRPRLVLAGRMTADADSWMPRLSTAPLAGTVEYRGYVADDARESLYGGARALILPSLDEGFGLTALEAMSAGVPVVAARRGAIPEVTGGAADLVDATDTAQLAAAIVRAVTDDGHAQSLAARGLERARHFSWDRSADLLASAYRDAAVRHGAERSAR